MTKEQIALACILGMYAISAGLFIGAWYLDKQTKKESERYWEIVRKHNEGLERLRQLHILKEEEGN